MRVLAVALTLLVGLWAAPPVSAEEAAAGGVVLVPAEGTVFVMNGRAYRGTVEMRPAADGLVVVERVDLDGYLGGIREVPFSWPAATLGAQAVAARTYLAWSLARGRAGAGAVYGFDICASTACQVYRGSAGSGGQDADRWLAAVTATAGEILVYGGQPAQTLYSSSSGLRTRANQDVFGGSAKPYLQPVDSPESGVTPYETWQTVVPVDFLLQILRRAGYVVGAEVRDVQVVRPGEGGGTATLDILTDQGMTSIGVVASRWLFNEHGPALYPGVFPSRRPDGRRWPQTILSYTYDVEFEPGPIEAAAPPLLPVDDLVPDGQVVVTGTGWGHGVGMSQWGAKAMGDAGETYDEILAHYYGGLIPVAGDAYLPDEVAVGLAWGEARTEVAVRGDFTLVLPNGRSGRYRDGVWAFAASGGQVVVEAPESTRLPALPIGMAVR